MSALFWQILGRTAETEFIFSLFHLLLAGVGLLVLLRNRFDQLNNPARRLLIAAFTFFAVQFAIGTLRYGTSFFFDNQWNGPGFLWLARLLGAPAIMLAVGGLVTSVREEWKQRTVTCVACLGAAVLVTALFDLGFWSQNPASIASFHKIALAVADLLPALAAALAWLALARAGERWFNPSRLTLFFFAGSGIVSAAVPFAGPVVANAAWHAFEHFVSFALVTLAWALGERSANLFDRVFVRLNLSFILLASIIILSTVGLERFQYVKFAEQRSSSLAEYLRGFLSYYSGRGENLAAILQRPEVMRRIIVGFGELPDFERLEIYLGPDRAVFRYARDKTISQEVGSAPQGGSPAPAQLEDSETSAASFRMIGLPVFPVRNTGDRIELYGATQYINRNIGTYIVVIYLLFTVLVATSIVLVGMIVRNADSSIQKQNAEIRKIGEQLLQAAKLASIGELAGGVAHEINNPITAILCTATHLIDRRRDTSLTTRDRRDIGFIAEQSERITAIVSKLLTFSRQSRMELSLCNVNLVVESAISLIEFRLHNGSVTLKRELADRLPAVSGDANRLAEVLVNLMNNALDAMPAAGTLTVRTETPDPDHVRIAITDTGSGIDPVQMDRIFDPFFTTKEPGKGTGLGLSISHGIVRGHQGEIQVQSAPGAGSTFAVILPLEAV